MLHVLFNLSEPEDEDVDRARDILLEPARDELDKGEHQDLFFFIGADVSYPEFLYGTKNRTGVFHSNLTNPL